MMSLTIFLVVLIGALVLGNILLALIKPGSEQRADKAEPIEQPKLVESQEKLPGVFKSNPSFAQDTGQERANQLNKRIDRLESLLLKINGSKFLGKKLNGTVIGQKLSGYNEFKGNTKIEIAALKQDIARVKKEIGIKEKKNPGEDYQINDKKLHELVFQTGAGKS